MTEFAAISSHLLPVAVTLGAFVAGFLISRLVVRPDLLDKPMLTAANRAPDTSFFDAIREVVLTLDGNGRIRYVNKAWQALAGSSIHESLGKPLAQFVHPDDRGVLIANIHELTSAAIQECSMEIRITSDGSETRWAQVNLQAAPGVVGVGLVGTLDDVTPRKIAELSLRNINRDLESRVRMRTAELEASNRELEAFSYSISHDLRAPLRSIDGFARILEEDLDGQLTETSRSHLQRIRNAAKRMAELTDAMIAMASLSRHAIRRESVDLSELVTQIIEELREEEPERQAEIEVTAELVATADLSLMRVALENLLRNAWKFSTRNEVTRIAFHAERQSDQRVFMISDNGIGFDMAHAGRLFEPFFRLHGPGTYQGTGIGLSNVERIIRRHGGHIWARSSPGHGTTFFFTLG
jgi:PAS domain S-box-containing protein